MEGLLRVRDADLVLESSSTGRSKCGVGDIVFYRMDSPRGGHGDEGVEEEDEESRHCSWSLVWMSRVASLYI